MSAVCSRGVVTSSMCMWQNEHPISIVHSSIQEVCGSSRIVTALVLKLASAQWGATALWTSYLMLNTGVVENSAFADILSEAAWSHNCLVRAHSRV